MSVSQGPQSDLQLQCKEENLHQWREEPVNPNQLLNVRRGLLRLILMSQNPQCQPHSHQHQLHQFKESNLVSSTKKSVETEFRNHSNFAAAASDLSV